MLNKYDVKNCSLGNTPIAKRDMLSLLQNPKNDYQKEQMKDIPYSSAVESLMYAQVCTHSNMAYAIEKLGRYVRSWD